MVIKAQDIKETDKLVTMFTEDFGKINVLIKGAKRSKSQLLPLTLPFCYCDLVLFKGKSMYTFNEGNVIETFQNFLTNIDTLTYATYFLELIDISMVENEINRDIFKNIITNYYLIKNKVADIRVINIYFEYKILKSTGYGLNLDRCASCKTKLISSNYFNLQAIGGICGNCEKVNGVKVSYESYSLLKYIPTIALEKLVAIHLSNSVLEEIQTVLFNVICQSYSKKPKSLEILNIF